MLILSDIAITPLEVETGKQFVIAVKVSEVNTTWAALKNALPTWAAIKARYTTWKQVKQG
ncbi:MAG: hypothetical protein RR992_05890 [Clostridiales bacterium]